MQSREDTRLEQAASAEGAESTAEAQPKRRGRPPGSKNKKKKVIGKKTSKKKTSKKKATKKKATKKKAAKKKVGKKKATKKKASKKFGSKKVAKKKRGKKKTTRATAGQDSMARLMAAVEELREAVVDLAQSKAEEQQSAVADLRKAAQSRIAEIEDAAVRSLKKFGL